MAASRTSCLLLALGVASWLLFFWLTVERPDRSRLISDSAAYADLARSLSRHQGYVDHLVTPVAVATLGGGPPLPSTLWSPLYPALTSLWFTLLGSQQAIVPILVNALGFLVALLALFLLGRIMLGTSIAWVPPCLMALDPRILGLASDGLTEGWFTAFLFASLLLLLLPGRGARHVAAAGLMLGLAQLTRVTAVSFLPVVAVLAVRPPGGRRADADTAPGRAASGFGGLLAFAGAFLLVLAPWLIYRAGAYGSIVCELQRYNLLHDLGPWVGSEGFRSLDTPDPLAYVASHPGQFIGKLIAGALKSSLLVPLSFLAPVEFALAVVGTIVMLGRPAGRYAIGAILALAAIQLVVGWSTLLDPRLWQPVGVLVLIPLAAGLDTVARRLLPGRPRLGTIAALAVVAILPFGQACLESYLQPTLGWARFTEADAEAMGAWANRLVPPGDSVLSDFEELVWYADRAVVWRPVDPGEVERLRSLSGARYALWHSDSGACSRPRLGDDAWHDYLERELARGGLEEVARLHLESGAFVLGRWP